MSLLSIYPQLLRNFLYKVPTLLKLSSLLGVVDWMRYIFSRDLLIAEVCPLSEECWYGDPWQWGIVWNSGRSSVLPLHCMITTVA